MPIAKNCMNARNRYVLRDTYVNIFLSTNANLLFVLEGNELEYFPLFFVLFSHYFQHDIRLFRLWNVYCIKFLIVKINAVFVVGFAHLADEWLPVDSH